MKYMCKYFKHCCKINKLLKKEEKIQSEYLNLIKNNKEESEALLAEENIERNIIEYEIETENTMYYLRLSKKKCLEIPDINNEDFWITSSLDQNRKILSNKAINILKKQIHEDRKYYTDLVIQVITALTGLIGVLIGLVIVLKQH